MKGKVVIVTGGARGIGFATAQCFAKQGADIVVADCDAANAARAAKDLEAMGVRSLPVGCDVTDRPSVDAMVAKVVQTFGQIDVLVNNAGICPFIPVMEMSVPVFKRTIDVNLIGAFHCTQAVAAEMIKRGKGGRIIFITSLAENVTGEAQVDYGASKGGMRMLMVGFATALGKHRINCNAVAPGIILTDMGREHWEKPENQAFIKNRVPMGRIGYPEDIGKVAVFLASEAANYVHGISIRVDGGHQACCA